MKKTLLITALSVAFIGTSAMAQDYHHYISGKGSVVRLENKFTATGYKDLTNPSYNLDHKKNSTVAGLRLAYGVNIPLWSNDMRMELEYGYNGKAKLDGHSFTPDVNYKSEVKSQFLMANVYYDFDLDSDWTPYVGAGIGYARVKSDNNFSNYNTGLNSSLSKSSGNFAWNLTAGIAYDVTDNLSIDASYRYMDYGKAKASDNTGFSMQGYRSNTNSKVRSNELNLGVRYRLNYNNN